MARTRELAYFRRAETNEASPKGFTLLELLVVMAILAGLVAIALPAFQSLVARVRASFQRADIEQQLRQLPQQVRESGRGGVLIDPAESGVPVARLAQAGIDLANTQLERAERLRVALPEGWSMHLDKPIYYHLTGACSGGEIDFSLSPQSFHYILAAPLCRPQLDETRAR